MNISPGHLIEQECCNGRLVVSPRSWLKALFGKAHLDKPLFMVWALILEMTHWKGFCLIRLIPTVAWTGWPSLFRILSFKTGEPTMIIPWLITLWGFINNILILFLLDIIKLLVGNEFDWMEDLQGQFSLKIFNLSRVAENEFVKGSFRC